MKITLEAARVNAGMTQTEVVNALKISNATLVNWEKGRTKPSYASLLALSNLYGWPVELFNLPSGLTESKFASAT